MPLPKQYHTSKDYWNLPEGQRAELIDGTLYDMAPPSYRHQFLIAKLSFAIQEYIFSHAGNCQLLMAPFAVNLDADDKNWVKPDISVICDRNKLHDQGCFGAPDWIIEIVSPSSRRMDYSTKNTLYSEAGVQEYWIVDPEKERTTVYRYAEDAAPIIFPFHSPVSAGLYPDLEILISSLLKDM